MPGMLKFDDIPDAAQEESVLNSLLDDFFQHKHFKNTTQRKATVQILKRETDVIVSLPKGHGRTTCFQLPILICQQKVSIVFVGLPSRVNMQITRLNCVDAYVEILDAETSSEEWVHVQNTIYRLCNTLSSQNSILYVTLDVISTVDFSNLLDYLIETNNLGYIVVDESYCENEWMSGQKQNYHALGLLRCTYNHIPWIVVTTKPNVEVVNCIKTTLCLRTQRPDIHKDSVLWFGLHFDDDIIVDY